MFDVKAFGSLIRYLRIRKGMSQMELAEAVGAESIMPVAHIERGNRLYINYLFDICRVLGISIEFHITGSHIPSHLAAALSKGFDFTELEDRQQAIILAELTATHMAENDLDAELALKKVVSAHDKREEDRRRRIAAQAELRRMRALYAEVTGSDDDGDEEYHHDAV
jgi:transcriptional regulator with XRE-family HTH domain